MKVFIFLIFIITGSVFGAAVEFSTAEVTKIREILNQMADILEGNHKEILELEDVLAHANTQLRTARTKETIRRNMNSFRDRLKDMKKLRNTFVKSRQLKEYIIALDDRLKVMEDNVVMIEKIYFPEVMEIQEGFQENGDYPTFINPGDPRYELDEDEKSLARAIQKTRNLLTLKEQTQPVEDHFTDFVEQIDENLKNGVVEREQVPVLGKTSLDRFYEQLATERRNDATYKWEEDGSQEKFREFYNAVEQFQKKPVENQRVITAFPAVDDPKGSRSRATFFDLVTELKEKKREEDKKQIVVPSAGVPAKIMGFNEFMNEIASDGHTPSKKDFNEFLDELQPVHAEVILKHRTGLIAPSSSDDVLVKKETIAWLNTDQDFLSRLRAQKTFQQADEYYEDEKMLVQRTRTKTKTRLFSARGGFDEQGFSVDEYVASEENARNHRYEKSPFSAGFFVQSGEASAGVRMPEGQEDSKEEPKTEVKSQSLVRHELDGHKSLIPVTVQLLDEDSAPFVDVELAFKLVLEDNSALKGMVLESKDGKTLKSTDSKGEATVHLLMQLDGKPVKVERELIQSGDQLTCLIHVSPDEKN